jgi:hypothetical protein
MDMIRADARPGSGSRNRDFGAAASAALFPREDAGVLGP